MRKKIFLLFLFLLIFSASKVKAEELTGYTNTACVYNGGYSVINRNGTITGSFTAPNGIDATCKANYNYGKSGCPLFMNVFAACPMGSCNCSVGFSEEESNNSRKLIEETEGCSYTTKNGTMITMTKSGSTWKVKSNQSVILSVNDDVKNVKTCPKKIYVTENGIGVGKTMVISLTSAIDPDNLGGTYEDGEAKSEEKPSEKPNERPSDEPVEIPITNTEINELCKSSNLKITLKYVGWVLTAIKVIIPILIIIFGAIDFFKVMISNKSDEIPKAIKALALRVIAGVVISFIPILIHFLFALIDDWNDYQSSYSECTKCLYDPKSC